jgi:hypothetical protein
MRELAARWTRAVALTAEAAALRMAAVEAAVEAAAEVVRMAEAVAVAAGLPVRSLDLLRSSRGATSSALRVATRSTRRVMPPERCCSA